MFEFFNFVPKLKQSRSMKRKTKPGTNYKNPKPYYLKSGRTHGKKPSSNLKKQGFQKPKRHSKESKVFNLRSNKKKNNQY